MKCIHVTYSMCSQVDHILYGFQCMHVMYNATKEDAKVHVS